MYNTSNHDAPANTGSATEIENHVTWNYSQYEPVF